MVLAVRGSVVRHDAVGHRQLELALFIGKVLDAMAGVPADRGVDQGRQGPATMSPLGKVVDAITRVSANGAVR